MKIIRVLFGSGLIMLVAALLFLQPGGESPAGSKAPAGSADARNISGAQVVAANPAGDVIVSDPVEPVLTIPAREAPPVELEPKLDREINPRIDPYGRTDPGFRIAGGLDPLLAVQANAPAGTAAGFDTPIFNFEGQGFTFLNPPDTVGDIGTDHYIQMVNATIVTIYDKTDASQIDSFDLTALGGCATGFGDPIVLYDHLDDRWLLSEFGPGNSLCVFISQTPDPTGAYFSYQFSTPNFPDYPKYGVWPDAYYVTSNENSPANYALDRDEMLQGNPATSQRFIAPPLSGFGFQTLTPADHDGMTLPPAGAPGYFMRHVDTEAHGPGGFPTEDFLEIWAFDVDWNNPGNSTFTQVANISVTEFDSDICGLFAFSGVPMPGVPKCSGASLDPLREVVMHRLQYRNFGSHEMLLGNLVTDVTGNDDAGVRWFELRQVGAGSWSLHQEGTYAPDGDGRWMGAIAMDGSGNIALGYNVSSSATFPSLRYAGRLASDPLGTLPQGEYDIIDGSGSNGSNRYGDYAAMSVDPVDDCTFWFTGEYNPTSQWSTRIAAMRFDACGAPDFTLSADPNTLDICAGTDAVYDLTIGSNQGFDDPVTLSAQGEPAGTTTNFSTNPVIPPGMSTFTIGNTGGAAAGSYNVDIIGMAPTSTHTTTVQLNVFDTAATVSLSAPPNGAVDVPLAPTFMWSGTGTSYTIEIATDANFNNIVESATVGGTSYMSNGLAGNQTYYWRVTAENICGQAVSPTWSFTTIDLQCSSPALSIPDNDPTGAFDEFMIGPSGTIDDLNVSIDVTHTWVGDLVFELEHVDTGTSVVFYDRPGVPASTFGCSGNDIDATLDDEAGTPVENECGGGVPTIAGTFIPNNLLSAFDGEDLEGTWRITASDLASSFTGTLNTWCVEAMTSGGPTPTATSPAPTATSPAATVTSEPPTATATSVSPTATSVGATATSTAPATGVELSNFDGNGSANWLLLLIPLLIAGAFLAYIKQTGRVKAD